MEEALLLVVFDLDRQLVFPDHSTVGLDLAQQQPRVRRRHTPRSTARNHSPPLLLSRQMTIAPSALPYCHLAISMLLTHGCMAGKAKTTAHVLDPSRAVYTLPTAAVTILLLDVGTAFLIFALSSAVRIVFDPMACWVGLW